MINRALKYFESEVKYGKIIPIIPLSLNILSTIKELNIKEEISKKKEIKKLFFKNFKLLILKSE